MIDFGDANKRIEHAFSTLVTTTTSIPVGIDAIQKLGGNLLLYYSKATSQILPDIDRFSIITLSEGAFFEPSEMTILPNNDILIGKRRGNHRVN